ncbi:hypothetical protein [Roseiconus lacunae]|uniref:hypothetical protein n=1 Tax=Roseiconus lacunae TaxID=2605694 RepID=UPI0013597C7A|nr:hypothetical protein [Roseiconus lacunae]
MTGPDQVDGVGDRMVKMRLESDANATSDRSGSTLMTHRPRPVSSVDEAITES